SSRCLCTLRPPCILSSLLSRHPPLSTLFPYTTLFRSRRLHTQHDLAGEFAVILFHVSGGLDTGENRFASHRAVGARRPGCRHAEDRKSTRLNSSHGSISYAVFCLKKNRIHHATPDYTP